MPRQDLSLFWGSSDVNDWPAAAQYIVHNLPHQLRQMRLQVEEECRRVAGLLGELATPVHVDVERAVQRETAAFDRSAVLALTRKAREQEGHLKLISTACVVEIYGDVVEGEVGDMAESRSFRTQREAVAGLHGITRYFHGKRGFSANAGGYQLLQREHELAVGRVRLGMDATCEALATVAREVVGPDADAAEVAPLNLLAGTMQVSNGAAVFYIIPTREELDDSGLLNEDGTVALSAYRRMSTALPEHRMAEDSTPQQTRARELGMEHQRLVHITHVEANMALHGHEDQKAVGPQDNRFAIAPTRFGCAT